MTTFIAWLALTVSAASLAWQVLSWRNSGPRIRVQLRKVGRYDHPGAYVIIVSNDGRQAVMVLEVRANIKRSLVSIESHWGVDVAWVKSERLPVTIQPGAEARFYATVPVVQMHMKHARQMQPSRAIRESEIIPQARIGTSWVSGSWLDTPWRPDGHIPPPPNESSDASR